jgi:hypothetical protein
MKPGGHDPMEPPKINREIVAVLMESPFYFTIPLKRRLEFIIFFSQQPIYNHICELNDRLICGKDDLKRHNPTRC